MPRPVHTKGGKQKRKPLNASLPTQLVIDFNTIASEQGNGKRDALLGEVLLAFVEKVRPESKSVRQLRSNEKSESVAVTLTARDAARTLERVTQRDALKVCRECAVTILDVTNSSGRMPPKPSLNRARERVKKAS